MRIRRLDLDKREKIITYTTFIAYVASMIIIGFLFPKVEKMIYGNVPYLLFSFGFLLVSFLNFKRTKNKTAGFIAAFFAVFFIASIIMLKNDINLSDAYRSVM